jgi:outer membrane protein assembly factor BamB
MNRINLVLTFLFFVTIVAAQPFQWRGSNRDGKFTDTGLLKKWPDAGPELVL